MNYKNKLNKMGWNVDETLKRIDSLNEEEDAEHTTEKDLVELEKHGVQNFFNIEHPADE